MSSQHWFVFILYCVRHVKYFACSLGKANNFVVWSLSCKREGFRYGGGWGRGGLGWSSFCCTSSPFWSLFFWLDIFFYFLYLSHFTVSLKLTLYLFWEISWSWKHLCLNDRRWMNRLHCRLWEKEHLFLSLYSPFSALSPTAFIKIQDLKLLTLLLWEGIFFPYLMAMRKSGQGGLKGNFSPFCHRWIQ